MKTLINNIKAFLEADIVNNLISAIVVEKGLPQDMQLIPFSNYPYIALGDGGERVEDVKTTSQNRIYTVVIIMGVWKADKSLALDDILDLSNQVKTSFEKLSNRQKDSHIWGVNIVPFDWSDEKGFYMGRSVSIDFISLEDRIFDY
jgi:hypothetical protein